jgi:apolipoprotein N-acyltransferase
MIRKEHSGNGRWSKQDVLPVVSGLMLGLSFAPTNLVPLAFVGLIPLLVYLDGPVSKAKLLRAGLLFPIAFYGLTLNWLAGMVGFSWLAAPGYLAIVLLHLCGFFVFLLPVVLLRSYVALPFIATAPFAWVACECIRGYGDMGFPWCTLGYALTRFPFMVQFADVVGVFGVSFWLLMLNVLLFEAWKTRHEPRRIRKYLVAGSMVFASVLIYDTLQWFNVSSSTESKEVAIIQPNIPQRIKWDEHYSREILDHVFTMNIVATTSSPDLVVWPETAIPYYIDEQRPFQLTEMGPLPPGHGRVLTGLLTSSHDTAGRVHYFNAAGLFDEHGEMLGLYKKIFLVPGAEQYPFRRILGFTRAFFSIQDISYGAMDPGNDFKTFQLADGTKFSTMICYESVYPQVSRSFRKAGARFLVNITNDAWFGHSFAPYQHASFLVMRAIENRTAIVRCGNTGISGFLDSHGRWQQKTPIFREAILAQPVLLAKGQLTFYTRHGDLIVYVSYIALGLFLVVAIRKKLREV